MMSVSAMHPLTNNNHYIADVPMADVLPGRSDSIEALYSSMGMALLGTLWTETVGLTLIAS